jgi:hypothetical protein
LRYRAADSSVATLVVTLLLGLAACDGGATGPEAGLERARARWASRGPTDYTVTIVRSCECLPEAIGPVAVTVRGGTVTARHYVPSGAAVAPQFVPAFPSVEGLFEIIEDAIRDGVHPLYVRYDAGSGYPTRVELGDPSADAPVYMVSELRPE